MRWERRQRQFRLLISVLTVMGLGGLLFVWPLGRRFVASLGTQTAIARFSIMRGMGIEPDRAAVEASWSVRRRRGIDRDKTRGETGLRRAEPGLQEPTGRIGLEALGGPVPVGELMT